MVLLTFFFRNAVSFHQAIAALDGVVHNGYTLRANDADSKPSDRRQSAGSAGSFGGRRESSGPSSTVFVGNLSFNTGEDELRESFSNVGDVVSTRIATDRESGQHRG